jgi:crotonobetainyl-CoA:carnitine CoA-transferase CaiB-like acyl-CoA transferase
MSMQALQGIRVLDLSHVIAGPTASHYLALEGAEVIKVEPPGKGDILRWARDRLDQGVSVGFAAINGGKQSLAIDLKHPTAQQWLTELVRQSDVFIENYRPGAVARLGFDYEQVRAIKPDIVYASISGFGQEGEWATRPAYDHVVQSAMGMGWMQGEAGQDPVKVGFPVIDSATGMVAAQAILAALLRAMVVGRKVVDVLRLKRLQQGTQPPGGLPMLVNENRRTLCVEPPLGQADERRPLRLQLFP